MHHLTLSGLSAVACCTAIAAQDFHFMSSRNSVPGETRYDIFRYDQATGTQTLLRTAPGIDSHPVPINGRLWYSRRVLRGPEELFSMLPNGTDVRRETFDGGDGGHHGNSHPFPIPGTNDLLLTTHREGGGSVIRRRNGNTGAMTVLVDDGFDVEAGHSPSDGTFVYYSSDVDGDFEIYRRELATGATVKLTDNTGYDSGATLEPTGNVLVYTSEDPGDPCSTHLWTMDWQGNNKTQRTFASGHQWAFVFDGTRITYATNQNATVAQPGNEIHRLDLTTNISTQLVASGFDDRFLPGDPTCDFEAELELEATPLFGPPGTTVAFAAPFSDWPFSSFRFDFGDGTSAVVNTTLSPAMITHTYLLAGSYRPTVTASDTCTPPNTAVAELPLVTIHAFYLDLTPGLPLGLGDDQVVTTPIGITFPFPSPAGPTPVNSIAVDSNGRLMLPGATASVFNPSVTTLLTTPSICALWADINPGSPLSDDVYVATHPAMTSITWRDCVYFSGSAPFTMQAQLHADGRIAVLYDGRLPNRSALIGISDGSGNNQPGSVSLAEAPFSTGSGTTAFHELGSRVPQGVRGLGLLFTPDANGGWTVDVLFLPFAAVESLGVGCPPQLVYREQTTPRLGTMFETRFDGAFPGTFVLHAIGFGSPALDLGLGDCRLWTTAESIGVSLANASGTSLAQLPIPNLPTLLGATLSFQGAAGSLTSPLGFGLSNGLIATLGL